MRGVPLGGLSPHSRRWLSELLATELDEEVELGFQIFRGWTDGCVF